MKSENLMGFPENSDFHKIAPCLKTCSSLSFLMYFEVISTHFHFFALFAPTSLFRSKITFPLQNHFFAPKSLFCSKITFSLQNQLFAPLAPLVSERAVACRFFSHLEVISALGVIFSEI